MIGSFLFSFLKHSENSVVRLASERVEAARVGKSASGLPTGLASGGAPVFAALLSNSALRPLLDGCDSKHTNPHQLIDDFVHVPFSWVTVRTRQLDQLPGHWVMVRHGQLATRLSQH